MKKKKLLFVWLFSVITLSGCADTGKQHQVSFSKDKFKVDVLGNVQIKGKVSGLSEGNYKANIDRENVTIHLDNKGKFELNTFILNSTQKIFPIGIETPDGNIIVGSAPLDTEAFSDAMEAKETVFPDRIINLYKEATLAVENERNVAHEEYPFKFREGITFSDGTTKANNNITIFSFKKSSQYDIAKEYFLDKSKPDWIQSQSSQQLNSDPLKPDKYNEDSSFISDAIVGKIFLNYQKEYEISKNNPLYHCKIAYYPEKKILMVSENGISNVQFAFYKQIIDNYQNQE